MTRENPDHHQSPAHRNATAAAHIAQIFNDAQFSRAGHRKLIHRLYNVHKKQSVHGGEEGEQSFFLAAIACLNCILGVKRNEECAKRALRFFIGFVVWSIESAEKADGGDGGGHVVRFSENLMLYALEGIDSKDRMVRIRLAQIVVSIVNSVDELGDGVWCLFVEKMTERLFDKEASVRVQALYALGRLQEEEIGGEASGMIIRDVFEELMCHDPVPEVRRVALDLIEVNADNLGIILDRARDRHVSIRKLFFAQKMPTIDVRSLSAAQREILLSAGLGDRDTSVRSACMTMLLSHWIRVADNNLVQLLLSLDVRERRQVGEDALRAFYDRHPQMFGGNAGTFTDPMFYEHLTPETALALRVYAEFHDHRHHNGIKGNLVPPSLDGAVKEEAECCTCSFLEEGLPTITELVQYSQAILDKHSLCNDDDQRLDYEFILIQLQKLLSLLLSTHHNQSNHQAHDEVGKRQYEALLVELCRSLEIEDELWMLAVDDLIAIGCGGQWEQALECCGPILADLYCVYSGGGGGGEDDEDLKTSMESLDLLEPENVDENKKRLPMLSIDTKISAQLRTVLLASQLATCLLSPAAASNVNKTALHPTLLELIDDIFIPSINCSFVAIQAEGLRALGSAMVASRWLAGEYASLFVEFWQRGDVECVRVVTMLMFDLACLYPSDIVGGGDGCELAKHKAAVKACMQSSLHHTDTQTQTIASQGYIKLLLHKLISPTLPSASAHSQHDECTQIIASLLTLYYHEGSAGVSALRQSLAYFVAVVCDVQFAGVCGAVLIILDSFSGSGSGDGIASGELTLLQIGKQLIYLLTKSEHDHNQQQLQIQTPHHQESPDSPSTHMASLAISLIKRTLSSPSQTRQYLSLLAHFAPTNQWPLLSIKKIVFLLSALMKRIGGGEKALVNLVKKCVGMFVEFDDPMVVLGGEDVADFADLLAADGDGGQASKHSNPSKVLLASKPKRSNKVIGENVLHDLTDILE